jgi:hypothetical protein
VPVGIQASLPTGLSSLYDSYHIAPELSIIIVK